VANRILKRIDLLPITLRGDWQVDGVKFFSNGLAPKERWKVENLVLIEGNQRELKC